MYDPAGGKISHAFSSLGREIAEFSGKRKKNEK